ncbi:MAG TPA: XRE family transcriptional regulator [Gemmatimonadaceae bacterium]|nr:XRE family transcriptional regulator [Gemmatimonadaceae bacterium]
MSLGSAVRSLRTDRGLTLDALAARSGVSRAMLSDVERDRKSPTIRVVCQIAAALEVPVSELVEEEHAPPRVALRRRGDRRPLVDPETGVERHVLSDPSLARGLEVVWYVLPAGADVGSFPAHARGSVEHITIAAGAVEMTVGAERIPLRAGDSISYRADVTHGFRNTGRSRAELFLVIDARK